MKIAMRVFLALVLCFQCSSALLGQDESTYLNATGSPSFATQFPIQNGFIDISNGNIHLEFPIATHKQRGDLKLNEKIVYDSRIWAITHYTGYYWGATNVPNTPYTHAGWRFVTGAETGGIGYKTKPDYYQAGCWYDPVDHDGPGDGIQGTYNDILFWTDPSGTTHQFAANMAISRNDCTGEYTTSITGGYAIDGSGYYVSDDGTGNPLVRASDGTEVYPQVTDRYGNYWQLDGNGDLIDDEDRKPVITSSPGAGTEYLDVLAQNGPISNNGARVRYTVYTAATWIQTNFGQSGVTEWQGYLTPVTQIALPDGSSYYFTYDIYGGLSSMTLPTGGTIYFDYTNYLDSSNNKNRWVGLYQLSGFPPTTFTPSVVNTCSGYSTGCMEQVVVQSPSDNETTHLLMLNNGAWDTSTVAYNGPVSSGVALKAVSNTYDFSTPCDPDACTGSQNINLTTQLTTLEDTGDQSTVETTYDNSHGGRVASVSTWDYADPYSGIPTKEVDYAYTTSGFNTQSVTTYSHGTKVAQTTYNFSSSATSTSEVDHGAAGISDPYLQSIGQWLDTTNTTITTSSYTMYDTGNIQTALDYRGNSTSYTYQCHSAYPLTTSKVISVSVTLTTTDSYDCSSGALLSEKDPNDTANSHSGTVYTYDSSGRVSTISKSDGGSTTFSYPPSYTEIDQTISVSTGVFYSTASIVDGFGRPSQKVTPSGTTETTYDNSGRTLCVTNMHSGSSSPTDGTTCNGGYDGLDRPLLSNLSDGASSQSWSYVGPSVTSTDEAGHSWTRTYNASGQLTEVVEPGGYTTLYKYDGLGNLNCVEQHGGITGQSDCSGTNDATSAWRIRRFNYDSLNRLTSESSPEAGTTTYSYLSSGSPCSGDPSLACSSTDSRSKTIYHTYDAVNRETATTSSDGSVNDTFYYDLPIALAGGPTYNCLNGIGRVCLADHPGISGTAYNYDELGRVKSTLYASAQSNLGYTSGMAVVYDLAGQAITLTYPDGRVVNQSFSGGQLQTVTSSGTTYFSANSYAPTGQLTSATIANGLASQTFTYNRRLEMCAETATVSNDTGAYSLLNKQFFYPSSATTACGDYIHNNGTISKILDYYGGGSTAHEQDFTYDSLNRLTSAVQQDGLYNMSYSQDPFGNMLPTNNLAGTHPSLSITGSNQVQLSLTNYGYGANGTLTSQAASSGHTFTYGADNLITQVDSGGTSSYGYNGDGERAYKTISSGWKEYVYLNGAPMSEHTSADIWSDYIYANGRLLAKVDSADTRFHLTGTNNPTSDPNRWVVGIVPLPGTVTLHSGDVINFRMYQHNAVTGISMGFTDGSNSDWYCGACRTPLSVADQWVPQSIAVPPAMDNKTIGYMFLGNFQGGPDGEFDVMLADLAVTHVDGTVSTFPIPIGSLSWGGDTTDVSGGSFTGEQVLVSSGAIGAVAQTRYFVADHLGSNQYELADGSWPVWRATYTPYGEEVSPQETSNSYKFAGLERDAEMADPSGNGLDHTAFREYSAPLGRWMSPDPYNGSMDLDNPQSLNRYGYGYNNPLFYKDSTGLDPLTDLYTLSVYVFAAGGEVDLLQDILAGGLLALDVVAEAFAGSLFAPQFHGTLKPRPPAHAPNNVKPPDGHCGDLQGFDQFLNAAKVAMSAWPSDSNPIPWLRGIIIHSLFTSLVRGLPNTSVNIPYMDGRVANWHDLGSVRPDAVFGDVNSPNFIVELKTGGARLVDPQYSNYLKHLPGNTRICEIAEVAK